MLLKIASLLLCLLLIASSAEALMKANSAGLLSEGESYNDLEVLYQGEAIGDIMGRGEFVWINVRDADGAIGVFAPRELVSVIEHTGSYQYTGDTLSVRGIFHQYCREHGGDSDIHASKITVSEAGQAREHPLEPDKVKASMFLSALALLFFIIHLILRRFR